MNRSEMVEIRTMNKAAMNRAEMVKIRTEELSRLSDTQLVDTIAEYFRQNMTMPGEKALKDLAAGFAEELEKMGTGILSEVRRDMIEEFASICVKEVRLKKVKVVNKTKQNKDAKEIHASDLPMVLSDEKSIWGQNTKTIKYQVRFLYNMVLYNMIGTIPETGDRVRIPWVGDDITLAFIPEGFRKNHKTLAGMQGTVIATDYSNGNFANMSYSLLIDLGQNLTAAA